MNSKPFFVVIVSSSFGVLLCEQCERLPFFVGLQATSNTFLSGDTTATTSGVVAFVVTHDTTIHNVESFVQEFHSFCLCENHNHNDVMCI